MNVDILRRVPLFGGFNDAELSAVAARFVERRYAKGDVIWRAGDEGDEFLVVSSGQLDVLGAGADGGEQLIGQLGAGECAGEIALLLDERRSATLTCSRQATVLALSKPDFRELVHGDARALAQMTELLSRRALSLAQRRPVRRGTTVVGVIADAGVKGASLVAGAISEMVPRVTGAAALLVRVGAPGGAGLALRELASSSEAIGGAVVDRGQRPAVLDVALDHPVVGDDLVAAVEALTVSVGQQFRLVVVDLPASAAGDAVAGAFDVVISVGRTDEPRDLQVSSATQVIRVLNQFSGAPPRPINQGEPYVLRVEQSLTGLGPDDQAVRLATERRLPVSRTLYRLTRKLFGVSVGAALGAGAAFGCSHVGVLMALEEAGIEIDLVAGSSMGSIIGAGYAGGLSAYEMEAISSRMSNLRSILSAIQPSLLGAGLFRGQAFTAKFKPLMEAKDFEELILPFRAVACDLSCGERIELGSGRLDVALQASCAVPFGFTPVKIGERMLVDGGMVDPVPAEVVRSMGADLVIAVNVVPQVSRETYSSLTRLIKRAGRLNPLSYITTGGNPFDLIEIAMNSLQTTWHELGNFKSLSADVVVDVDLAEFTWIDFHKADALVERGHAAGKTMTADLQELINQRLQ